MRGGFTLFTPYFAVGNEQTGAEDFFEDPTYKFACECVSVCLCVCVCVCALCVCCVCVVCE